MPHSEPGQFNEVVGVSAAAGHIIVTSEIGASLYSVESALASDEIRFDGDDHYGLHGNPIAMHPEGKEAVRVMEDRLLLLDFPNGRLSIAQDHKVSIGKPHSVRYVGDHPLIAVLSDEGLIVLDPYTGVEKWRVIGVTLNGFDVAHQSGRILVFFNRALGAPATGASVFSPDGQVVAVAFERPGFLRGTISDDGHRVLLWSEAGGVTLWQLDPLRLEWTDTSEWLTHGGAFADDTGSMFAVTQERSGTWRSRAIQMGDLGAEHLFEVEQAHVREADDGRFVFQETVEPPLLSAYDATGERVWSDEVEERPFYPSYMTSWAGYYVRWSTQSLHLYDLHRSYEEPELEIVAPSRCDDGKSRSTLTGGGLFTTDPKHRTFRLHYTGGGVPVKIDITNSSDPRGGLWDPRPPDRRLVSELILDIQQILDEGGNVLIRAQNTHGAVTWDVCRIITKNETGEAGPSHLDIMSLPSAISLWILSKAATRRRYRPAPRS